jgi:hypothetical protein
MRETPFSRLQAFGSSIFSLATYCGSPHLYGLDGQKQIFVGKGQRESRGKENTQVTGVHSGGFLGNARAETVFMVFSLTQSRDP